MTSWTWRRKARVIEAGVEVGERTASRRRPGRRPAGRAAGARSSAARSAARCTIAYASSRARPAFSTSATRTRLLACSPRPRVDVLAHPLGADDEPLEQAGHPDEHVVEDDRRVGQDDPLGAGMADVALVPERLVLQRRVGIATQQARESGDPLRQDRIALVGHRRRALLAGLERLLDLADLGVLEVPDLGREALERAAEDRDRSQQRRVPVALDDLGADRIGVQSEVGEDLRLDVRAEVAVRPHRARDLAGPDLVDGGGQAAPAAVDLERPAGELEPECRRLGVDRMGSAHHHGVRLGARAARRGPRCSRSASARSRSPAARSWSASAGVDDVAARQAEMEVPALRADRLGDLADERDDVVVGRPFDLGDALDIDVRPRLEGRERVAAG